MGFFSMKKCGTIYPMKKRTRKMLFMVAVVIFMIASVFAVFRARGYAFDWTTKSLVQTGAISVGVNTSDVKLFIDDHLAGSSSILSKNIGKNGLTPGEHTIRVTKDGLSSWTKKAVVQKGLVVEFPKIMLFPLDEESTDALRIEASKSLSETIMLAVSTKRVPAPEIITDNWFFNTNGLFSDATASSSFVASNVLGIAVPQGSSDRVLWWNTNELWVFWRNETSYQPYRMANEKERIIKFSNKIKRAAWFRDEDHIIVDLGSAGYRIIETDTRSTPTIFRF